MRGAMHIIFYSLPDYAQFYPELVSMLGQIGNPDASVGAGTISCLVLFTQSERMALGRIVGAQRCSHMLASAKQTFMFK